MGIARRVKSVVALAAIAVGVSVAAGTGATIAGADPAAEPAPPGTFKERPEPPAAETDAESCCYQQVTGLGTLLQPGGYGSAEAVCPTNQGIFQLVLGGGGLNQSGSGNVILTDSYPVSNTTWRVYMKNTSASTAYTIWAYAVCGTYYPINGPQG